MHSNNIINLLKLEDVRFINLDEQGDTTTLFFKRIARKAFEYMITKLKKLNFKDTSLNLGIIITTAIQYFDKESHAKSIYLKFPKIFHYRRLFKKRR